MLGVLFSVVLYSSDVTHIIYSPVPDLRGDYNYIDLSMGGDHDMKGQ